MVCVDVGCSQSSRTEAAFTQDPDLWNGLGRNQEQSVLFGTGAELVFPFSERCGKGSPLEKLTSLMVVVAVVVDLSGYPGTRCEFFKCPLLLWGAVPSPLDPRGWSSVLKQTSSKGCRE